MIPGIIAGNYPPPPPPAAYGATIFDNTESQNALTVASQTATDSPYLTISTWLWIADYSLSPKIVTFANDPSVYFDGSSFWIRYDGKPSFNFNDEAIDYVSSLVVSSSAWNHIFASFDMDHAKGAKLKNILLNGTADSSIFTFEPNPGDAFNIPINSKSFAVPNYNWASSGDFSYIGLADLWIAHGQYLTAADVTKFRTPGGSRVDLGADGSTPTGTPPTYFFKGGAGSFVNNLGAGDSVSLVGSLSDAPDAPAGP